LTRRKEDLEYYWTLTLSSIQTRWEKKGGNLDGIGLAITAFNAYGVRNNESRGGKKGAETSADLDCLSSLLQHGLTLVKRNK